MATKAISKLKDRARSHEQKEEWESAIRAYEEILRAGEEGGQEQELALYNRVGDLYLRLGRPEEAVQQYERAAERYADAGLYNNAIALCNKALRYMPDRRPLFRQLGRLCAAQGFLVDARRWFLEFAERSSKAGDIEEALSALEEFASLSDDPSIREMLARQLQAHDRSEEALTQLRQAYALHLRSGDDARAEAVKAEAQAIDPDVDLALPEAPPSGGYEESAAEFGNVSLSTPPEVSEAEAEQTEAAWSQGVEDAEEPAPEPLARSEPAPESMDTFGMVDLDAGAAITEPEEAPANEFGAVDLSGVAPTEEVVEEADEEEPAEPLPLLGFEDRAEEETAAPLPLLDTDAELDTSLPIDSVELTPAEARAPEKAAPEVDVDEEFNRARSLLAKGDRNGALEVWDRLHEVLARGSRFDEALRVVSDMAEYDADSVRLRQLRVEYASRAGDDRALIEAYVELARALNRRGAETKARAVAQQVLELDPENADARALLSEDPRATRAREYVDLSGFLEPEPAAQDATRFVVSDAAPSGDEERDFADMLSQFKAKVAENVSVEDASSHYDLGLAFKEMGLVDEAISEFQTALRGGEERLKVYEELGDCFVQKGQYNVAVKILTRALHLPHDEDAELIGVYYLLGRCHEELGQRAEARDAYERVIGLEMDFRDVPQRLAKL